MADCGELVSEVEEEEQALEPVFDPSLVHTVDGTCRIEPREGTPNEVRTFAVDVENPNAQAALATVSWALVDVLSINGDPGLGEPSYRILKMKEGHEGPACGASTRAHAARGCAGGPPVRLHHAATPRPGSALTHRHLDW